MKKVDECGVELRARSQDAPVRVGTFWADFRDSCRFVFDKCHPPAFSLGTP